MIISSVAAVGPPTAMEAECRIRPCIQCFKPAVKRFARPQGTRRTPREREQGLSAGSRYPVKVTMSQLLTKSRTREFTVAGLQPVCQPDRRVEPGDDDELDGHRRSEHGGEGRVEEAPIIGLRAGLWIRVESRPNVSRA